MRRGGTCINSGLRLGLHLFSIFIESADNELAAQKLRLVHLN